MKKTVTYLLVLVSTVAFSQEKKADAVNTNQASPRTSASSVKVDNNAAKEYSYDVNDKYMGRKDEFLFMMTVPKLPSDFPLYNKEWGIKEYNAVVDAYCMMHLDIMKDGVKQKLQMLINKQQTK